MTNTLNKIIHNGDEYQFPDTTYSAGDGINIDANNEISNAQPGPIVSANQPSSASEGDLWYDTTNDELKVYDGSQWKVSGGATYTAGKGIAILNGTNYSAMRGPCDEGYHVPNETELTALITALTTLGLTLVDTTAQTYLLMPLAGVRDWNDGSVSDQGTEGHYRSCDSASSNRAKRLQIDSYDIAVGGMPISIGASIRPFKDEAVIPDSGRTTLYAGTGDAGIFHNSTDGVISISADGTTWMTIADKNLGATTVYNYGDTESQANCGYYYQWGNNYGFTWTGAVTTSSTQVDASSYGPSEYSSSTFITDSPRDYPRNLDLWGGVTGTTQNNNAITNLGVLVSDQANNIFTPGMKIWGGTQSDYQSLTPDSNTAYLLLAGGPTPPSPGLHIDDSFIGTTLDTSVWDAIQFGNEGSYVVNNGLAISSGPNFTSGSQFLNQGYVLSTKGKFLGTESKITVEVTYTGYDNISYDGGSFSILGTECRDGAGAMDSVTGVIYTTRQSWGYALSYFSGTQANFMMSNTTFSNPITIKLELDIANNTSNMYINGTLSHTKTNVLYSGKSWNDYIGNPIFTLSPRYGSELTIHVSNIKVTVE